MTATRPVRSELRWLTVLVAVVGMVATACGAPTPEDVARDADGSPTATATEQSPGPGATATATETPGAGELVVLSNSAPHVSVIDTATNQVVRTAEVADFTSWTWNDDNNHYAAPELWLGTKDPDTDEVEVVTLDLDTLEITHRIPVGTDELTLYIGKPTQDGVLHVGKMGSGEVVAIDTSTYEVLDTFTPPVNGDVVCDADITAVDGQEQFVYPTREGDTIVTIDAASGETIREVDTPDGATPLMLTTSADGTVWVQETDSNTNAVFTPDLELVERFPSGQAPIVNTFSPDGSLSYIGHSDDPVVQVIDTATLEEVTRVQVGSFPQKIAVHPGGRFVYPILTEEGAVAVIDTADWEVVDRIPLGTDPTGVFMRPPA